MYKGLYLGSEPEELVESGSLLEPGKGGAQGRAGALSCIRRVRRLSLHGALEASPPPNLPLLRQVLLQVARGCLCAGMIRLQRPLHRMPH